MPNNPLTALLQQQPQFVPPQNGDLITYRDLKYLIGEQIGTGAFGAVYNCWDEWGNELVAKILIPQTQTYSQLRNNWMQEFVKLQQLRHPRITFIHQAFECNNNFYLIVEKCESNLNSLFDHVANGSDGEIWLPYIARDVLNALHYIHEHGYVHKDLHPGNILISLQKDAMVPSKVPIWQFKIADLGISRLEGDIRLFNTILAQWMLPPEHLDPNQFGVLGKHIDIYHFGLLLLGLVVNPLPRFTPAEILEGEPRKLAENHSSAYAPVIARALRRNVSSRTQSALCMWREISAVAQATY